MANDGTASETAPALRGGILILAAGSSRRFGGDKRKARLTDGRTLLAASLDSAAASGLPCLLCLAADSDPGVVHSSVRVHYAAEAGRGMGATLASGIRALPTWDYALVALGDMPWIQAATFRQLAGHAASDRIVIPVHNGRRGHPVAFGKALFPDLALLDGDLGAKQLVASQTARVDELAVDDPGILLDVDTPNDLRAGSP